MTKKVPKYVLNLLDKRRKLANDLIGACVKVDDYCEKIGIDLTDTNAALVTDVRIYCEPDVAYLCTYKAIKSKLNDESE